MSHEILVFDPRSFVPCVTLDGFNRPRNVDLSDVIRNLGEALWGVSKSGFQTLEDKGFQMLGE